MRIRLYITILIVCMSVLSVQAQENSIRQIYNQAESEYEIGRIEQALALLQDNIQGFKGNMHESAYRLMALCWLSLDNESKAEECTRILLSEDPYYTASPQDPQRFVDLVENLRSGLEATITTASSRAETLSEVPVPTTLITREMIRNCGGTNLQEVLAAYVPGMNIVDCNDDINIAMRGIYSNGQEKILFMLNGHRLNSYCTNIAAPDFSMSLEKIKQIEVLRGPASSLYGGVALTGVVNIITKEGASVDGVKIKGGIGNYGQLRGDIIFGKRYFDLDILVWGSIYGNKGQKMDAPAEMANDKWGIPEKEITVGRIGNNPSFDFGMQLIYKNLHLMYDTHFSEVIPPYSVSTMAKSYAHDKYRTINGYSPSFASKMHHVDLSYHHSIGKLNLKGTVTYDNSELTHYQVILDAPFPELGMVLGLDSTNNIFNQPGLFRFISGDEHNIGGQINGDISYIDNGTHKGSITFGTEFSHFYLADVRYTLGANFEQLMQEIPFISEEGKGHENSYNGFLQLKHQWHSVIFNAGLRYDHKKRVDGITLNELSPRVALILLKPEWNFKLSYSRSFVDAPYMYRRINDMLPMLIHNTQKKDLPDYTTLSPEFVNSLQVTFGGLQWIKGLNFELNGFYNEAKNLIQTQIIQQYNEGTNKTAGVEFQANYHNRKISANFNLTWTHTFKSNVFSMNIDDNNNTPTVMSNLVFSWQTTPHLRLHSHVLFESRQTTYNLDVVKLINYYMAVTQLNMNPNAGAEYVRIVDEYDDKMLLNKSIPARAIFNIGAEYQLGKFTFGLNIRNLFNKSYYRSGMNTNVVCQKGRWFLFDVSYKF